MIIPEQNKYREAKESELVVSINRGSHVDIQHFIDTIKGNPELEKIEGVIDAYNFINQMIPHLEARDGDKPFKPQLDYLVECVENHGLPEKEHLDDHATRLIAKYENGYGVLLSDPLTSECFEEVKAHKSGELCSERYEGCLQHLHSRAADYDKLKKVDGSSESKKNNEVYAA